MTHMNDDQPMMRGKHIGYLDPADLDQASLEEGLGTLMAELRREKRMARDTADQALRNFADHQSRIVELAEGAARYRKALGLPALSGEGLDFTLIDTPVGSPRQGETAQEDQLHSESIPDHRKQPDSRRPGVSND